MNKNNDRKKETQTRKITEEADKNKNSHVNATKEDRSNRNKKIKASKSTEEAEKYF